MPGSRYEAQIRGVLTDRQMDTAIDFEGTAFAWGQAKSVATAIENIVDASGLGEFCRIGLMGRNLPIHFAALWGIFLSGRCVSNIHAYQPSHSLIEDFQENRWPVVFGDIRDWTPQVIAAAESAGTVGYVLTADPEHPVTRITSRVEPGTNADTNPRGETVIQLLSSGTTGKPKRIDLSRKAIDEMIERTMVQFALAGPAEKATQIMPWPLSSLGGTNAALPVVTLGQCMAIQEKFNAPQMLEMLRKYQPSFLSLPPSALATILQLEPEKDALASVKLFSSGAAPLDPNVRRVLFENYGVPAAEFYGATEFAGIITGWTTDDLNLVHVKAGSVGRALPGIQVRVVAAETGEILPVGKTGLVEALVPRVGNEWVRTNDLAHLDDDGFLYIEGRADDTILRGGLKVSPLEIVEALRLHEKVGDAAVIGLPDERLGSVPAAAVETRVGCDNPTVEELEAFLRTRLSAYKIPVRFEFVNEIPRTQSMKPQRQKMLAIFDE